jgi:hypothetical protein
MTDIGVVSGLIELTDNFTSEIGLAKAALSNFTKENQESLIAVAGAAGIVTAAIGGIATAVLGLGNRGADVNDLNETLEHFSGSARAANDNMEALRQGTKNTVDDFALAKDAAHLLSAGVRLTADDFGILGQAAFVLQNRGLGGTKEQLELVSDAMITGRTRALAMAVGVVDAGDAEENYAKKLGVTKDQLSESGKIEARRIEVMRILSAAVKDAGEQERDFGEQLEALKAGFSNYIDNVASAIAKSPVLAAGMKAIGDALSKTFGGDNQDLVKTTVHWIEQGTIVAVNFGLGAIELARVVNVAWSGIKTIILGTETAVVGLVDGIIEAATEITRVMETLHLVPEGSTHEVEELRTQLRGMTADLAAQTAEAARGVVGHSAFDATLDELGGTLFGVKDAMEAASKATTANAEANDVATKNTAILARTQQELTAKMIDQAKVDADAWKVQGKSIEETTKLWDEYFKLRVEHGGTTLTIQKAQIQQWFDDEVAKLNDADNNWSEHYAAIEAVAKEKLSQVGIDWDTVRGKSIEALRDQRDTAKRTYDEMIYGSLTYTRTALEEQRQKISDLDDEMLGYGKDAKDAQAAAAAAAQAHTHELEQQADALERIKEANRAAGGSSQFTRANLTDELLRPWGVSLANITPWLTHNYSLEDAIAFFKRFGAYTRGFPEGPGPRMTGFKEGGVVDIMVGENGPEAVRVPLGSTVYPTGTGPGTSVVNIHMNVNGTGADVARQLKQILTRDLKSVRQFGAS